MGLKGTFQRVSNGFDFRLKEFQLQPNVLRVSVLSLFVSTITMFSVKMPLFAAITAAMMLTVDATSKAYVRKTKWSSAGCNNSADIISDA